MRDASRATAGAGVPADVARRVRQILNREQVLASLPEASDHRLRIEGVIEPGLSLAAAHAVWKQEYLETLPGLAPFSHQPPGAVTPAGLVRVSCECVHGASGGMSSYHGFTGYFVSLLVSVPEERIWDARVEAAT
jgi:hypothetical protein